MTKWIERRARRARPAANYVGGGWVEASSGGTYAKTNPMRPSESVGEFSSSSAADVDARRAAAADAFAAWAALPLAQRGAYLVAAAAALEARVEEIARDMTTEMGKPLREARGETVRAGQILRYRRERGVPAGRRALRAVVTGRQVSTRRRPVGVVGADHAVELPDRDPRLEARAGADVRQHRRAEARLRGAAHRPARRRGVRRGRAARRGAERADRPRLDRRRRARAAIRACARSRSPARSRPGTRCATRRRRPASASSSSSAATTR